MSVKIVLSEPWDSAVKELGLNPTLELGPFERVSFDGGWWFGDGERIAEVFQETMNDKLGSLLGHPLVGYILVPRSFSMDEQTDPDYPGKPYEKLEVVSI